MNRGYETLKIAADRLAGCTEIVHKVGDIMGDAMQIDKAYFKVMFFNTLGRHYKKINQAIKTLGLRLKDGYTADSDCTWIVLDYKGTEITVLGYQVFDGKVRRCK